MVTKAKLRQVEAPPADWGDLIDADTLGPAILNVRSRMGLPDAAQSQIYVYLINADGEGHDARVWEGTDPESFNLKTLALKFGSGGYRIAVYMPDAQGISAIRINNTQYIKLSPAEEAQVSAAREAAKNPAIVHQGNGDMATAIQTMMAGFQQTVAQILDANKSAPQPDPFAMIERVASIMGAMKPAAPATDLPQLLGMMKTLKELTGTEGGDGMSASEKLLLQAGSAFLPALAEGLKKPAAPAEAPQAAPALPAPAAPVLSPADEDALMKLHFGLVMAVRAASRGADAAEHAQTVYDQLEENEIQDSLTNPQWFEEMCRIVPDCAQWKPWFEAGRAQMIEWAIEDNLLARNEKGDLTLPPDSGTTGETPEQSLGPVDVTKTAAASE